MGRGALQPVSDIDGHGSLERSRTHHAIARDCQLDVNSMRHITFIHGADGSSKRQPRRIVVHNRHRVSGRGVFDQQRRLLGGWLGRIRTVERNTGPGRQTRRNSHMSCGADEGLYKRNINGDRVRCQSINGYIPDDGRRRGRIRCRQHAIAGVAKEVYGVGRVSA